MGITQRLLDMPIVGLKIAQRLLDMPIAYLDKSAKRLEPKTRSLARRSYAGASTGPRDMAWRVSDQDAIQEVCGGYRKLRARTRDLVRNNGFASHALDSLVSNIIGTGIKPDFLTGDKGLDRDVNDLWDSFARQCSASSLLTIYGEQSLAVRCWLESGEVLVRKRIRPMSDGLAVPLQIQLLEPDFLDDSKDEIFSTGGRIVGGIEFDLIGRRRSYYLFTEHPGSGAYWRIGSNPIPAVNMAHLYQELRIGQVRGITRFAPIIQAMWDLCGYSDAERVRKRSEACVSAFISSSEPEEEDQGGLGIKTAVDSNGYPVEELSPGALVYLPGGKEVKFNTPGAVQGYAEFIRTSLHEIAAGMDLPYEYLAGDLSQVNFSSIRLGRIEFVRTVRSLRQQIVIPLFCEPILKWFLEMAIIAGKLPDRPGGYPVTWSEPEIEEVDRYTDAKADEMEMRIGTNSRINIIRSKGRDPDKIDEDILKDKQNRQKKGIMLDSDPSQTTKSGQAQMGVVPLEVPMTEEEPPSEPGNPRTLIEETKTMQKNG